MYRFPTDPPRWRRPLPQPSAALTPPQPRDPRVPDLHSQLEGLFDAVWEAEENWRFDDRLDQAVRQLRD